jgi:hypothetical protein
LTYSDDHVPACGTLDPSHTQRFIKRLRKALEPLKIRYFLVGEYGDKTQRPHYHAALFGYPSCEYGKPRVTKKHGCPCEPCKLIEEKWEMGHTYNGTLTKDSAQYISGYVTKKMTSKDDERLNGRHPEFARMSNRPGIGANSLDGIIDVIESEHGCEIIEVNDDVPHVINYGRKQMPLGRYLRERLRKEMGWNETKTPEAIVQKLRKERIEEYFEEREKNSFGTQKELLLEKNKQRRRNLEKKSKIYLKEKLL